MNVLLYCSFVFYNFGYNYGIRIILWHQESHNILTRERTLFVNKRSPPKLDD